MSMGLTPWSLLVLFRLLSPGHAYFNYIHEGKVTLKEIEAEIPAFSLPGTHTPAFIPIPTLPQPGAEDMNIAYYPSPDDDGTYLRVDMSETPAMTFHYMEGLRPVSLIVSLPGFNFWPKKVTTDDVKFFLFTKKTGANGIELFTSKENRPNVEGFWYNDAMVKILCHGFTSSSEKPFPQLMKNSYMKLAEDLNVILVDWSKLAMTSVLRYFEVAKETTGVGQQVASLVRALIKEELTTLDRVHFIGHSLGAHVGGAFGFTLERAEVGKVSRITGLDPAGPGFCNGDIGQLQTSDALFVDVIHTDDSGYCDGLFGPISWWLGSDKGKWGSNATSGHSNFFPNGGNGQPGCGTGLSDTCSHSRAYYYMEESFNGTGSTVFKGCPCLTYDDYNKGDCICSSETYVIMGEYTPVNRKERKYFLKTGNKYPYSHVG